MLKRSVAGFTLLCIFCFSINSNAQYAADALRYSESDLNGSARYQALGGNHAAIGGDASAVSGNPAGLGFYNRSEISISPAVTSLNNKATYIDGNTTASKGNFNISQASLVLSSQPGFQRKWKRSTFGISFSRQQSFQDVYNFSARNDKSAYLDKVIEDVNGQKTSVTQLETDFESSQANGGPVAYSLPAAYYQMYLINPSTTTGPPYTPLDRNSAVNQYGSYSATGANTQWSIAYAGNYNDKFYIGGSVGFSRIRYEYDRVFEDSYISSPELVAIQQGEGLSVTGNGVNFTLGAIYKINPIIQIGGSLTSPTFTTIKETFTQNVSAQFVDNLVTGPDGTLITPPYTNIPLAPNDFQYKLTSPLRASVGATGFIGKSGFVTATVEYAGYAGMGVSTKYLSSTDNADFRSATNNEISSTYRNTVNFRLGGEFRANLFRARLGFGYISDPYASNAADIDRSKLLFSAGVGIRTSRYFADLTGSLLTYKSAFTPYTLAKESEYASAQITSKPVNVMATVGVFF